jgi:large subunit ribosomal protein L10
MNKDEKAALVDEIAERLGDANAIFAVDYRGISVPQAAELRTQLSEADATFRVVKNRLAKRAVERAGAAELTDLLAGPTALAFVKGDAVTAAKAISTFGRQHDILEYKGGVMDGAPLAPDQFGAIARLPGLDVLRGQFVGVAASPLTGLTRGLASLLSGLATALGEIQERGLVSGEAEEAPEKPPGEEAPAEEAPAEAPTDEATDEEATDEADEAVEQPAAEADSETSEATETDDFPGEPQGEAEDSEGPENHDGSDETGSEESEGEAEDSEEGQS